MSDAISTTQWNKGAYTILYVFVAIMLGSCENNSFPDAVPVPGLRGPSVICKPHISQKFELVNLDQENFVYLTSWEDGLEGGDITSKDPHDLSQTTLNILWKKNGYLNLHIEVYENEGKSPDGRLLPGTFRQDFHLFHEVSLKTEPQPPAKLGPSTLCRGGSATYKVSFAGGEAYTFKARKGGPNGPYVQTPELNIRPVAEGPGHFSIHGYKQGIYYLEIQATYCEKMLIYGQRIEVLESGC